MTYATHLFYLKQGTIVPIEMHETYGCRTTTPRTYTTHTHTPRTSTPLTISPRQNLRKGIPLGTITPGHTPQGQKPLG